MGPGQQSKAKFVKAIMRLFKWQSHEQGGEKWESDISFYSQHGATRPRDHLTKEERSMVREAALEYGSIPAYNTVTPEERSRWKAYLAMRCSKKKSEVTLKDWEKANGWKIPSLVFASLDAGLRPIGGGTSHGGWVDVENELLRIPKDESAKGNENWHVAIRSQTADALSRWLDERPAHSIYEGSEKLWLTREGNPYQRYSLRYLLHQLCDIADISKENRRMSWYAIRHSVGTYMSREDGLAAAKAQLRHKSRRTTMRYDQTPVEERQKALNRMGASVSSPLTNSSHFGLSNSNLII